MTFFLFLVNSWAQRVELLSKSCLSGLSTCFWVGIVPDEDGSPSTATTLHYSLPLIY
jgi:hypothetical protein